MGKWPLVRGLRENAARSASTMPSVNGDGRRKRRSGGFTFPFASVSVYATCNAVYSDRRSECPNRYQTVNKRKIYVQKTMFRYFRAVSIFAMVVTTIGAHVVSAASARKPNIIYIMADDLGYGDLSCFGQTKFSTPNLDRLAQEGITFTDYYAGSTVCAPTRCVLMTGLHTGHAYVRGNREAKPEGQAPMPADIFTLPRMLKKAGDRKSVV